MLKSEQQSSFVKSKYCHKDLNMGAWLWTPHANQIAPRLIGIHLTSVSV